MAVIIQEVDTFDLLRALDGDFASVDAVDYNGIPESPIWDMFADKLSSLFRWRPHALEDMIERGQMDPIVIGVNGFSEFDLTGWTVGNGNHRLATALACMSPTVLVAFTDETDDFMLYDYSHDSNSQWLARL